MHSDEEGRESWLQGTVTRRRMWRWRRIWEEKLCLVRICHWEWEWHDEEGTRENNVAVAIAIAAATTTVDGDFIVNCFQLELLLHSANHFNHRHTHTLRAVIPFCGPGRICLLSIRIYANFIYVDIQLIFRCNIKKIFN